MFRHWNCSFCDMCHGQICLLWVMEPHVGIHITVLCGRNPIKAKWPYPLFFLYQLTTVQVTAKKIPNVYPMKYHGPTRIIQKSEYHGFYHVIPCFLSQFLQINQRAPMIVRDSVKEAEVPVHADVKVDLVMKDICQPFETWVMRNDFVSATLRTFSDQ